MTLMTVLTASTFILIFTPKFNTPTYRPLRGFTFIALGICAGITIVHSSLFNDGSNPESDVRFWIAGGVLYIGGALLYVARFPERAFPGVFCIFGSSHQLFHICVYTASIMHYWGSI